MKHQMHFAWLYKALEYHNQNRFADIAFASQMADECNDQNYPWAVDVKARGRVPVVHTQSYRTSFWRKSKPRWRIWLVHFIPCTHLDSIVRPNEPLALRKFIADRIGCIQSRVDAYVVGLAFHTLLDTGSHRSFRGFADPANRTVYGLHPKSVIRNPIGHMMDAHGPDTIGARWVRKQRGKAKDVYDNADDYRAVCYEACRLMDPASGVTQRIPYKTIAKATCDTDIEMYTKGIRAFKRPDTTDQRFWDFQAAAKIYFAALFNYLATGEMK